MGNVSIISFVICVVLGVGFLYEACMLIRIINTKQKNRVGVHILGAISTLLVFIMTTCITFDIAGSIPVYIIIFTCIVGIGFFFIGGLETIKIEKKK